MQEWLFQSSDSIRLTAQIEYSYGRKEGKLVDVTGLDLYKFTRLVRDHYIREGRLPE
jgi:hypothetical protein